MGVVGMWTSAEHELSDPLGPFWAWKVGLLDSDSDSDNSSAAVSSSAAAAIAMAAAAAAAAVAN